MVREFVVDRRPSNSPCHHTVVQLVAFPIGTGSNNHRVDDMVDMVGRASMAHHVDLLSTPYNTVYETGHLASHMASNLFSTGCVEVSPPTLI
uniref:Uncharacterized protein n=1 Tax=Cannabis sativa TaxID=3483 RepID=A0A803NYM4_CANSA